MATPNTEVYLCRNTRLYPGSEDTYYFASEAARQSFFTGKSAAGLHLTALSYQRETRTMRVDLPLETCEACDYLMFKNTGYSSKWYYAFITQCTYINDEVTDIQFQIDPVQTWLPSLTLQNQFIERETTATDTAYDVEFKHDEGMSTGVLYPFTRNVVDGDQAAKRFICFAMKRMFFTQSFTCYGGTYPKTAILQKATGFYANTPDGTEGNYVVAPFGESYGDWLMSSYFYVLIPFVGAQSRLSGFMGLFGGNVQDGNGAIVLDVDDVVAVFNAPMSLLKTDLQTLATAHPYAPVILGPADSFKLTPTGSGLNAYYDSTRDVICGSTSGLVSSIYVTQPASATSAMFDGYTPENKRCLQSPFVVYRYQDGNGGKSDELLPERFWDPDNNLHRIAAISRTYLNSNTISRFIQIKYYDGRDPADMTFELPDVQHYNFSYDTIASWEALNGSYMQSQQQLNMLQNLISGATSLVSGSASGVISAAMGETSREQSYQHALAVGKTGTPSTHGSASGNVLNTNLETDKGYIVGYCAHKNAVEAADRYFKKYGYRVNRLGAISFTSRPRFNFVKTNGFNASGNVPAAIKGEIAAMFERGLRFWHGDYLGDYSVSNAPS